MKYVFRTSSAAIRPQIPPLPGSGLLAGSSPRDRQCAEAAAVWAAITEGRQSVQVGQPSEREFDPDEFR